MPRRDRVSEMARRLPRSRSARRAKAASTRRSTSAPACSSRPKSLHAWMTGVHVSETSLRSEFERTERVRVTYRGKEVTGIQQPLMKEAMGRIVANAIGFGRKAIAELPAPETTIEVFPEGGAPVRIQCRPPEHPDAPNPPRRCTKDGSEVRVRGRADLLPEPPPPRGLRAEREERRGGWRRRSRRRRRRQGAVIVARVPHAR